MRVGAQQRVASGWTAFNVLCGLLARNRHRALRVPTFILYLCLGGRGKPNKFGQPRQTSPSVGKSGSGRVGCTISKSDGVDGDSSRGRTHNVLIGPRVPPGWLAAESEIWHMVQPDIRPMLGLSANQIRIGAPRNQVGFARGLRRCQGCNAGTPSLKTSAFLKLGSANILQS